jgi:hypothetical protein
MDTQKPRKPFEEMNAAERVEFASDVVAAFKKDIDSGSVVPESPPKTLLLFPIQIHKIVAPDNERESSVHGYFLEFYKAFNFAQHCGWYGSPGQITTPDGMFTDGTNFYHIEKLKLQDVEEEKEQARLARIEQIETKLTPEEIELLGLGQAQM